MPITRSSSQTSKSLSETSIVGRVFQMVKTPLNIFRSGYSEIDGSMSVVGNKQSRKQPRKTINNSWSAGSVTDLPNTRSGDAVNLLSDDSISSDILCTPLHDNTKQSTPCDVQQSLEPHMEKNSPLPGPSKPIQEYRVLSKPKKSKNGKKRLMKMKNKYPDRSKKQYCHEDCVNGRQYDREVIQCCICMAWIHEECALLDKHTAAVWTCKHCRRLPTQVEKIYTELSQVRKELSNICNLNENLLQILRENTEKISSLSAENARLKELTKTVSGTSNTQPKTPPIPAPRRALKNPSIPVENQEPAFAPAIDPTGMQNTRGNNYASRPRPKMRRRNRKTQMEVHPTATERIPVIPQMTQPLYYTPQSDQQESVQSMRYPQSFLAYSQRPPRIMPRKTMPPRFESHPKFHFSRYPRNYAMPYRSQQNLQYNVINSDTRVQCYRCHQWK